MDLQLNSMANQSKYDDESLNSNLAKDAMVQILLRLHVKALVKFRSVSKSWYNFLRSPNFIKLYITHQISRPASSLIVYNKENNGIPNFSLLHLNPTCNNQYINQLPLPFAIEATDDVIFEFFYNGLICLRKNIYNSPVVILWNPANRKYKFINVPPECSRFTYLKLGYVQECNDYKLLKVPFGWPKINGEGAKEAWVYTLSLNSWKPVPFTILSQTVAWGSQISLHGFMYWMATSVVEHIICFDLIKDEFDRIDVPDDRGFDPLNVRRSLMIFRESLAMMVSVDDGSRDTEIWVMKKSYAYGVHQFFWTKKFIIEPFSKDAYPLGIWNEDKLLVVVLQSCLLKQVYSYDLVTRNIDYFHVPKDLEFEFPLLVGGRYFESLALED